MSMNQAQFEKLIKELEKFAGQYPQKYKLRVKLLANLGYAYIILLIIFLLSSAGVSAYFGLFLPLQNTSGIINVFLLCLSIVPLVIAVIVIRSLKVYFPKPKGLELRREEVPKLFEFIDKLSSTLKSTNFDRILLTEEYNAGVLQLPSFFKPQENYLLLGLPLMCTLSLDQFRAVLAHELGHLSRNHSQLQGQVYLVRQTWYQVWKRLQESGRGSTFLLNKFFNWYAPFLYAYSFVTARLDEYEADLCAVKVAGVESIAEALIGVEINGKYLETSFWKSIYKQAHYTNLTPNAIYTELFNALTKDFLVEEKIKFLDLALDRRSSYLDTHPCLLERLTSIGFNPIQNNQLAVPFSPNENAAQMLLNGALKSFVIHFNKEWQRQTSFNWFNLHKESQELQERTEYLERQLKSQLLQVDKVWELANLVREFKGDEAAISKFRNVLDIDPNHSDANYALGSILIEQGDIQGVQYLEVAIEQDYEKGELGYELIRAFMRRKGNSEMAEFYRERGDLHYQVLLLAQEERSLINAKSKFVSHNLSKEIFSSLSQKLSDFPQMKEAYIVQKPLKYFPEKPLYVLGVVRQRFLNEDDSSELDRDLLDELHSDLDFPFPLYIALLDMYQWNLKRVISRVSKSKIPLS